MSIISLQSVDWSKFSLAKSGRTIKLLYDKEPVKFCTATLYSPFGVKSVDKEWSNFLEYSIDSSTCSTESSEKFTQFIEQLDNTIKTLVDQNLHLFNTAKSNATDDYDYCPIFRGNGNYPKLVKLMFSRDKHGNFESFVFDNAKKKIAVSEDNLCETIPRAQRFKCIIECSKVWYFNGKVGSMWNIVQLKLGAKVEKSPPKSGDMTVDYTKLLID